MYIIAEEHCVTSLTNYGTPEQQNTWKKVAY